MTTGSGLMICANRRWRKTLARSLKRWWSSPPYSMGILWLETQALMRRLSTTLKYVVFQRPIIKILWNTSCFAICYFFKSFQLSKSFTLTNTIATSMPNQLLWTNQINLNLICWNFQMVKVIDEFLDDYNQVNTAQMKLVLFNDAVRHVCRIGRIVRQPLGNALLLGMGGESL